MVKFSIYDALVQVVIVGFLAFAGPGMFNALNGLGGAGHENADLANAANACLYGTFAVFGYFGGAAFNLLGNKVLMFVGGLTYAIYAGTQYASGNVSSLGWMSPLGGCILGFGAGWFWTAQGAMMMAYSTPAKRGLYIAIFWVIFNLGGMIGGFITFGVNYHTDVPEANAPTYFTFIGIMTAGAIGALFLLVSPSKVRREDGELVVFEKSAGVIEELWGAIKVTFHKPMMLLFPLFVASNWFYTYQFNGVNGLLFTVRSRGLNSALYWGAQMVGSVVISKGCLDRAGWSLKKRGIAGFIMLAVELNFTYAIGCYLQYGFEGGYDKDRRPTDLIDFTDSHRAWFPICVYLLYGVGDAVLQTYAYWIMAALAGDDTKLCAQYAGFYKGIQSLGACIAWVIDLDEDCTYEIQFWLCWGLFVGSMVLTWFCVMDLKEPASLPSTLSAVKDVNTNSSFVPSASSSVSSLYTPEKPALAVSAV